MKTKILKVSVQILNYNGKHFLKDCFDTTLKQDYPNFEIVLIDNWSADGDAEFIKENYKNESPHPKGRGITK